MEKKCCRKVLQGKVLNGRKFWGESSELDETLEESFETEETLEECFELEEMWGKVLQGRKRWKSSEWEEILEGEFCIVLKCWRKVLSVGRVLSGRKCWRYKWE